MLIRILDSNKKRCSSRLISWRQEKNQSSVCKVVVAKVQESWCSCRVDLEVEFRLFGSENISSPGSQLEPRLKEPARILYHCAIANCVVQFSSGHCYLVAILVTITNHLLTGTYTAERILCSL